MRTRSRRCAALAICACCLPVALRLLLLGRNYPEEPLLIELEGTSSTTSEPVAEEEEEEEEDDEEVHADSRYGFTGAYMADREPRNVSYCRWQYDLPDSLAYEEDELIGSPESPAGLHRVLAFAVRGSSESVPEVTLCSHASADQVYGVVELARRWEGPLSLAVFAPGQDTGLAIQLLDRACRCEPAMARVSVHLVFPRDRPARSPYWSGRKARRSCAALDLRDLAARMTERREAGVAYPINVVRNVARSLAPTERVLVSDVELLPSEGLASRFLDMLRGRPPKRALAFVLPVFEVEASEEPPGNKAQLLAALRAGKAVYFHRFLCPHCQRFPGLTRWILRPDPGRVRPLIITRREYPHHRWEPIFIGTKYDPLYTEGMSWEGRQDKMTQMFEMCLMNYRLIILDGAFLVHTPGIKRKPADDQQSISELQLAQERQNARIYQRVTRSLLQKYPSNRRCRS